MNKEIFKGLVKIAGQTAITLFVGMLAVMVIAGVIGVLYNLVVQGIG